MKPLRVFLLLSALVLLGMSSSSQTQPKVRIEPEIVPEIDLHSQALLLEPSLRPAPPSVFPDIEASLQNRLENNPRSLPGVEIFHQIATEHTDWQLSQVVKWREAVEFFMEDDHTYDPIIILGIIGQESGGDPSLVCDFANMGMMCGVGLMQIVPREWTPLPHQLFHPFVNIRYGERMVHQILNDAVQMYGFESGYDALRAGLGAYNCGWVSLLAERCYDFGGYTYADNILNYWIPVLTQYESTH